MERCVGFFSEYLNVRSESRSKNSVVIALEHRNCKRSRERNIGAIVTYNSRERTSRGECVVVYIVVCVCMFRKLK